MGGIKNKLNKLTSRVKTLFNNTANNLGSPARGAVERSETEGSTISLSDYRLTSPFSQRGTKSSLPLAKGRQMSVAHRWGRITKYTSLACLTLAILSTITLNIISTYSSSNINSNAEPLSNGSTSTLANNNDSSTCDPNNTNAESCISLSITSSSSSSSTGGNDANLSLSIPQGGGIATGRHTVSVSSNNVTGYYVTLTGNAGSPAMVPSTPTSQAFIQSTTGTLTSPSPLAKGQWGSWGIALPNSSLYPGFNTNEADYNSTNQDVLAKTTWVAVPGKEADDGSKTIIKTTTQSRKTDAYPVYYGVRVDSPVSVPADTYAAQVVYTATTNEVPMPTITSINPNQYELGSGGSNVVTTAGANLSSAYDIYLQSQSDSAQKYSCTNIQVASDGKSLTCTLPTNAPLGTYGLYITTQGGTGSLANAFSYTESLPDGMDRVSDDYDGDGHVAVDYDENMIPVVYDETTKTWRVVTNAELQQNPKNWYNYTKKQWANALTVSKSSLQSFRDKQTGVDSNTAIQVDNNTNILGWWVYIPRYSYKVLRKEMGDHYAEEQNFEIVFETNKDMTKEPAVCNSSNSNQYYQDCIKNQYGDAGIAYPGNNESLKNKTVWATHPAFTWQYTSEVNGLTKKVERNGFWVGKFETTGTQTDPTVKPNQHSNMGGLDQVIGIGIYYSMSKSIGAQDDYNVGEGFYGWSSEKRPTSNGHNLQSATSHMIKNDEWGAVAYLSASKYGAGVSNVKSNMAHHRYDWEGTNYDADGNDSAGGGVTGCGPYDLSGSVRTYYDGTQLDQTRIESSTACSIGTHDRAWMGSIGQLASTTNNVYGVYDMAGGSSDRVAAAMTDASRRLDSSDVNYIFESEPFSPYINIYSEADGFEGHDRADARNCTWGTCGGHALYETHNQQYVNDPYEYRNQAWGGGYTGFAGWNSGNFFSRGGSSDDHDEGGIFSYSGLDTNTNYAGGNAVRVVLLPADDAI